MHYLHQGGKHVKKYLHSIVTGGLHDVTNCLLLTLHEEAKLMNRNTIELEILGVNRFSSKLIII